MAQPDIQPADTNPEKNKKIDVTVKYGDRQPDTKDWKPSDHISEARDHAAKKWGIPPTDVAGYDLFLETPTGNQPLQPSSTFQDAGIKEKCIILLQPPRSPLGN